MFKLVDLAFSAVLALTASAPALGDSNSAAEFLLNTCLAAMAEPAKVEAIAREHKWRAQSVLKTTGLSSESAWEVVQGEDRFFVFVGTMMLNPPLNSCSILFRDKNVNRDEFFKVVSASAEVTLVRENKRTHILLQNYEIKSDRVNRLMLTISSTIDGIVMESTVDELPIFPPTPAVPG